jgi:hypothetical protein
MGPDGTPAFNGRPLHWLEGGASWLFYGRYVYDTDKGTRLGELSMPGALAQWAGGGDTCQLVRTNEFGEPRLDVVKLDLAKARAAVGAEPAAVPALGDTSARSATGGQSQ